MEKKLMLLPISIILITILSGCTNSSISIDDYYFVISLGLDKAENNYIKLTIQIPSNSNNGSSDGSSSQSSSYEIYSAEAQTIDQAIAILDNYLNKQINLSHCSAIIISEELAKENITSYINSLSNNTELMYNCQTIISSSTAISLMENISNSGEAFSARLFDYLKSTTYYTGFTEESYFGKFAHDFNSKYNTATAIYTELNDNIIQTAGISIFKNKHLIGHISPLNSISHLIVSNKLSHCTLTIDSPFSIQDKVDFNMKLYKNTKINIQMINESPFISIEIFPEISILNSGQKFDYNNKESVNKLESSINLYFKKLLKNYLYTVSRDYNADIDFFQGIYKSTFLTEQNFEKIHWDSNFKNSFFEVKVNSKIISSKLFNKE